MSVTTGKGDEGYTSLLNGEKVRKNDPRIKLLGDMDELSSHIGLIKGRLKDSKITEELTGIQRSLSLIMAQVADGNAIRYPLTAESLTGLQEAARLYENNYINKKEFIMPGSSEISSFTDVCRSIARRAERSLIDTEGLWDINSTTRKYLNRLSDYFFVLGRYLEFVEEITYLVTKELREKNLVSDKKELGLTLKIAKMVLEEVEKKAETMGLPAVIALCNEWGNTIAVHFMDNAYPGSFEVAINKAFTSASFKMSTLELSKLTQNGEDLQGLQNTDPRIMIIGGGRPVKVKDKVVGAIGVSGGSGLQDNEIAEYGAEILTRLLAE